MSENNLPPDSPSPDESSGAQDAPPVPPQQPGEAITLPPHLRGGAGAGSGESLFGASAPAEPADLPRGFWAAVDYILHHPREIFESLRRDRELPRFTRLFFAIAVVMSFIYGAVMGATNLLQDSIMSTGDKVLQIGIVGVKVPVLFLLTLAIVLPPIYVSNAFTGMRYSFRQVLAMLLATIALTATVLASMATVAFFFSLTSRGYHFIKLLHVAFFAYAGLMGLGFLSRCLEYRALHDRQRVSLRMMLVWLLLYIFVGTQLAWVLRPFIGSPTEKFEVFRARSGNFYEAVMQSVDKMWND